MQTDTDITELTAREAEVLTQIARGRTNAEIAAEFVVSLHTVKTHTKRVLSKLGVSTRAEAIVVAYEAGVVVPGWVARASVAAPRPLSCTRRARRR